MLQADDRSPTEGEVVMADVDVQMQASEPNPALWCLDAMVGET